MLGANDRVSGAEVVRLRDVVLPGLTASLLGAATEAIGAAVTAVTADTVTVDWLGGTTTGAGAPVWVVFTAGALGVSVEPLPPKAWVTPNSANAPTARPATGAR